MRRASFREAVTNMDKENTNKMVIKETYLFKARITVTEANGAAFAETFAKGEGENLHVGSSSMGGMGLGFGAWLVNSRNENVLLLKEVQLLNEEEAVPVDLGDFVDKVNDSFTVEVESIQRNDVFGRIRHLIDASSQIDLGINSMEAAIQARLQKKIIDGVVTKEAAEARISFMRESGATDRDIYMFMDMWVAHKKDPEPEPDCKYQDNFLEESRRAEEDGVVVQCLKLCALGYGIMVASARGLGKYVLTQTVAWLLGLPIYHAIFNRDMSPEIAEGKTMTDNSASEWLMSDAAAGTSRSALLGDIDAKAEMELMKARAASVSIVIDKSEFYKCIADRGLMAVDELNCGDPNLVEKIFNPLLDGQRRMYFPGIGELEAERPFCVIATANLGYQGTAEQNMATMSRFKWIKLKYPKTLRSVIEASAKAELKRMGYDVNIRKEFMDACESFYNKIYKASSAIGDGGRATPGGQISDTALNIRGFVSALVVCTVFEGSSLRQYLKAGVIDVCDEEEVERLMEMLRSCVQQSF